MSGHVRQSVEEIRTGYVHSLDLLYLVYVTMCVCVCVCVCLVGWHVRALQKPFLSKTGERSLTFDKINGADDFWQWIDGEVASEGVREGGSGRVIG